jgi:Leucine-rich repeat (LRR) protein
MDAIFPNLEHLILEFTKFRNDDGITDFGPLLRVTSLHIIYSGYNDISSIDSTVELPNLQELGLTLPQINIAKRLDLPSTLRLILHANTIEALVKPSWESYGKLFGSITHVTFKGWKTHKPPAPNSQWEATTVLHDNSGAFKLLDSVTFIDSFVGGTSLVKWVARNSLEAHNTLEEVTLDACVGVTRYDCEEIVSHVQKLRVIV